MSDTEPATRLHESDPPIRTWGAVFALVAFATLFDETARQRSQRQTSQAMIYLAAVVGRVVHAGPFACDRLKRSRR